MLTVKINSIDMKRVQKNLRDFPIIAVPIYDKAVNEGARALAEVARANPRTPVDTGEMAGSIGHRKLRKLAAATFVGVRYGVYVHEGTGRMRARPFLKYALQDGAQRAIQEIFRKATAEVSRKVFRK